MSIRSEKGTFCLKHETKTEFFFQIMLSLIGYQFDRVITEERRRLLGIVQGKIL